VAELAADSDKAIRVACRLAGLDPAGARPLRVHADSVWLLPAADAVAKVAATPDAPSRARNAVAVTRWLRGLHFPCIDALPVAQPTVSGGVTTTFWRHLPQPATREFPDAAVLGELLRRLHALPEPPFTPPATQPTARLAAALDTAPAALTDTDLRWLRDRMNVLEDQYQHLRTPLGTGLIHNDAHLGNLLPGSADAPWVLGDWDRVATGPREWDLVPTANDDRFGLSDHQRRAFGEAYGYDLTTWPGWTVLRDLHELHSLAAYIRAAPHRPAAARELRWRLDSLQTGDRSRTWHAIS
jgi:hypothetical protein